MKLNDKNICAFQNWYETFKDVSFKSVCLPVPDEVLYYLRKDIVVIPEEAVITKVKHDNIDDVSYTTWISEGEDEDEADVPSFPTFSSVLKNVLHRLGGNVFVKMNWSAPCDAAWVAMNNSLKCSNLQDIYLLLKCSDKISKDLSYTGVDRYYIVLKKWEDIHPGSEFRCFVINNELIAITQRDKSEFHRHILTSKLSIVQDIKEFFYSKVKDKFLLSNFVFDVVWQSGNRVKLVDFSMFCEGEAYLFSWDELKNMSFNINISPEFRFIGEETGIQPSNLNRHFGMPSDLTGLSMNDSRSLIELLQNQMDLRSEED